MVPKIDVASAAIILDANGNVVGALTVPSTSDTAMIRARLGRDRRSVLYHTHGVARVGVHGRTE